jgi:hypothetical protein
LQQPKSSTGSVKISRDEEGRTQERQRKLLTPDEIIRPPQGNSTIFGRYVTAEYATYVIVLSRLTRIYERKDVRESLASVTKKQALSRVLPRGRKRKNDERSQVRSAEPSQKTADVSANEQPEAKAAESDVSQPDSRPVQKQTKRPIVVEPIGVIQ